MRDSCASPLHEARDIRLGGAPERHRATEGYPSLPHTRPPSRHHETRDSRTTHGSCNWGCDGIGTTWSVDTCGVYERQASQIAGRGRAAVTPIYRRASPSAGTGDAPSSSRTVAERPRGGPNRRSARRSAPVPVAARSCAWHRARTHPAQPFLRRRMGRWREPVALWAAAGAGAAAESAPATGVYTERPNLRNVRTADGRKKRRRRCEARIPEVQEVFLWEPQERALTKRKIGNETS